MATQEMVHRKAAVIVASDDKGRQEVFGIPAVCRLIFLFQRLGFEEVHLVGQTEVLRPVLSDLIPEERIHPAVNLEALERVVRDLALGQPQRVIVLKANQVIDRLSLMRLLDAKGVSGRDAYMEAKTGNGREKIYSVASSNLIPVLRSMGSFSRDFSLPGRFESVQGGTGFPMPSMEEKNGWGSWRKN